MKKPPTAMLKQGTQTPSLAPSFSPAEDKQRDLTNDFHLPWYNKRGQVSVSVYEINPLRDHRWPDFLQKHPRASVFHTTPWLEALHRTYGYEPIVYTTSPPYANLENGLIFCRVKSWLTGRRLVSLPFSDHCEPLVDDAADLHILFAGLEQRSRTEKMRYIEIRPLLSHGFTASLFHSTYMYCFHQLDLKPDCGVLFRGFHKDSTQRKIRRAEREALSYQEGRSETLLDLFYHLFLLTRRHHGVPPQPRSWFRNLVDCFGEALKIRLALKDGHPVAGILTLQYKDALVYKYGCSDAEFNSLGGTHLLFWRSIQEAKQEGLRVFDLGRSACDNAGLITFKNRWGATPSTLIYSRYTASRTATGNFRPDDNWKSRISTHLFGKLPDRLLCATGSLFYKHIG
jgi:CelD/BcsL family acetyltransferase involved in cellulose biosynthesis